MRTAPSTIGTTPAHLVRLGVLGLCALAFVACGDGSGMTFDCTEQGVRDAIAAGGGVHTFSCDGPTVVMTGSEIEIDKDVVLDGRGDLILDGGDDHQVLRVGIDRVVELRRMTVQHGFAYLASGSPAFDSERQGGGIRNVGDLTLRDCVVKENEAQKEGGGVYTQGVLTVLDSSITDNQAQAGGGVFSIWGELDVRRTTVSGNLAGLGGGIAVESDVWAGGAPAPPPAVSTLREVTIEGNRASVGAGIAYEAFAAGSQMTIARSMIVRNGDPSIEDDSKGGGLFSDSQAHVTVSESTLAENSAEYGGGIYNSGELRVEASTFDTNKGRVGGGLYNIESPSSGLVNLVNVTFWANGLNAAGTFGGGIYNAAVLNAAHVTFKNNLAVIGGAIRNIADLDLRNSYLRGTCALEGGTATGSRNITRFGNTCPEAAVASPGLAGYGELGPNGGPTETVPLEYGVGQDYVPFAECEDAFGVPVAKDQRGESRTSGTGCDVGAFEVVD